MVRLLRIILIFIMLFSLSFSLTFAQSDLIITTTDRAIPADIPPPLIPTIDTSTPSDLP